LPGASSQELYNFSEHIKILPGSLKMRKGSKCSDIFLQNRLIFAKKPKKREESKIFKDFLAEHIKSLPGSLKYFCAKHINILNMLPVGCFRHILLLSSICI